MTINMEIVLPIIIVGVIGIIAGIGLSLASKYLGVKKDEKLEKIEAALPGANCGGCGYSGCSGYAEAIFKGEAEPNLCSVGGAKTAAELSEILGVTVTANEKKAFVFCSGGAGAEKKYAYTGINSCSAVNDFYGGHLACEFGCLGLGDCVSVCEQKAISIKDGVAVVDSELCTGCANCVKKCPKGVIRIVEGKIKTMVHCNNKTKGAVAMKVCATSCIGCTKCAKTCEANAIIISDFLASIDPMKCTGCGKCKEVCPRKCIF